MTTTSAEPSTAGQPQLQRHQPDDVGRLQRVAAGAVRREQQRAKPAVAIERRRGFARSCIRSYAFVMRRITISIDDDLARLAEAEVRAGRSPSVSAWVADAIRAKARARAELVADLEGLEYREPTSPEMAALMARALGTPTAKILRVLKTGAGRSRKRRAA